MKNGKMLVLVLFLIAGSAAVYNFWGILMEFLTAAILAYLLNPLAKQLSKRTRMKHGLAVLLVLLITLALVALLLSQLIPLAVEQITGLVKDISTYASNYSDLIRRGMEYLEALHLPEPLLERAQEILGKSDSYLIAALTSLGTWLLNFSLGLVDVVVVVIVTVYLMLDGTKLLRSVVGCLPKSMARRVYRVLAESDTLIWKYLKARVIVSGGMGLVTYIGLMIIGVPYAALFAVMSFVLDFIPYFGSILAALVEGVVALITGGLSKGITVLIFVLIVQQIEGNLVAPKVQGDATGLHPVTVMFALLACNQVWGPVGMLISTPVAAVIKVVCKELYAYLIDGAGPTVNEVIAQGKEEKTAPVSQKSQAQ